VQWLPSPHSQPNPAPTIASALSKHVAWRRDLPTQVEAVNSFREFVEALDTADRIELKLKPILKDLLQHFFQMASAVEAMDVIMTVDTIVERIGEGIQPFAVDCCREARRRCLWPVPAARSPRPCCVPASSGLSCNHFRLKSCLPRLRAACCAQ
jgi:hypothetical protein